MSIKVVVLSNGDQLISDIKEILSEEESPVGYLLTKPHRVSINKPDNFNDLDDKSVSITLGPWILLTSDQDIPIPNNQVVTLVEPLDSLKEMYLDKTDDKSTSTNKPKGFNSDS